MYFSFHGVVNPAELALLRSTLDEHCERNGIVDDADRENVAAQTLSFFNSGLRDRDALLNALAEASGTPTSP